MRKRCLSCGGEYDDTMPDGLAYFHACPPIVSKVRVQRAGKLVDVAPGDVLPDDEEVDRLYIERPDKRDENVERVPPGQIKRRSEGKGAVDVRA